MTSETIQPYPHTVTWGFSATLIWSIVIALCFMIIQTGVMILYVKYVYPDLPPHVIDQIMIHIETNGDVLSLATFATFTGCTALLIGIIKLKKSSNIKQYLALNSVRISAARSWFLLFIGLLCCSELVTYLLGKPLVPEVITTLYAVTDSIVLLWIAIVVAAPVSEELFFRGFIISGLSATFIRPAGAIVFSSLAWAATHLQYDLYGIITIFVFGLLLGYTRVKTNSVLLTIGLHMFMNLVSMIETSFIVK